MRFVSILLVLCLLSPSAFSDTFGDAHTIVQDVEEGTGDSVMDTANDAMRVNIVAGSSSGTQYTEGDTDASITGTASMMEGAADTLVPLQGTAADGLLVNLGSNNDVAVTGSVTANAGTNLNTSALLTTAAHDAAFGTAGTADSQVMSIQGIASMTPVQVSQATASNLNATVSQATGTNLHTVVDSGTITAVTAISNALPAGNNNIGDVDVATLPSVTVGTFPDNEPFNLAQVNGTTTPVATAATDTTGAGVQQMGPLYQFDDVSTSTVTENRFAHPRISSRRAILVEGVASGTAQGVSVASGGITSGAVASGAFASGAVSSGAYASGSLASGAVVDITNVSMPITPATATATKTLGLGAEYRSTLPTWTNTQQGALQVGTRGSLHTELWNTDSNVPVPSGSGTATGALRVELPTNGTGTLATVSTVTNVATIGTSVTPGTGATHLGKAIDTATGATDTGVLALGTRKDSLATLTPADGDNVQGRYDSMGRYWVRDGGPCSDPARVTTAKVDTASSGNVEIVALAASQTIYVCGWILIADAAVDVQFIYGTGTACATGETDIGGPMGFGANGGANQPNTGAIQLKTASANALCIENSGAVQVSGHVTYVQTATP